MKGQPTDDWPRWARVRQSFPGEPVTDLAGAVADVCGELRLSERIRPGQRVAVTAGSRGIVDVVAITRAVVAELRRLRAEPFVFPCMGSHGGATPAGQLEVLHGYGLTDEAVGAPVISQGEVVSVGQTATDIPLWCDKLAYEADHILVVNRVKPHTDFSGLLESGPTKMLVIGLGKHYGANDTHRRFVERGHAPVLREVGDALWSRLPVVGGIGIVENGHERTVRLGAVRPESHESDEAALLEHAREVFGYLPFDFLHVLIVDEIGKDISGAGMDPNVTGADFCKSHEAPEKPFVWRILVRGLTPGSHGNGTGIGNADFALDRCVEAIDWRVTAINVITGASPEGGRRPLSFANDVELLQQTFRTTGSLPPAEQRLVRVANTLRVDDFLATEALLAEAAAHPRCEVVSEPAPMRFDAGGFLADPVGAGPEPHVVAVRTG